MYISMLKRDHHNPRFEQNVINWKDELFLGGIYFFLNHGNRGLTQSVEEAPEGVL